MAEVTARVAGDGKSGEDGVSVVTRASVSAGHAHDELHAETLGEVRRLIGPRLARSPDDLLQSHDVGTDLRDDVGDAIDVPPAVQPLAAMDVVGRDDDVHAGQAARYPMKWG